MGNLCGNVQLLSCTADKGSATLLQKNSSIVLGLYTLADIGIHYDGWSREDAIAFYKKYGIGDEDNINRIYDLILGSLEII